MYRVNQKWEKHELEHCTNICINSFIFKKKKEASCYMIMRHYIYSDLEGLLYSHESWITSKTTDFTNLMPLVIWWLEIIFQIFFFTQIHSKVKAFVFSFTNDASHVVILTSFHKLAADKYIITPCIFALSPLH